MWFYIFNQDFPTQSFKVSYLYSDIIKRVGRYFVHSGSCKINQHSLASSDQINLSNFCQLNGCSNSVIVINVIFILLSGDVESNSDPSGYNKHPNCKKFIPTQNLLLDM